MYFNNVSSFPLPKILNITLVDLGQIFQQSCCLTKVQLERLPKMPAPPPPLEEVLGNSTLEQEEQGKHFFYIAAIFQLTSINSQENT